MRLTFCGILLLASLATFSSDAKTPLTHVKLRSSPLVYLLCSPKRSRRFSLSKRRHHHPKGKPSSSSLFRSTPFYVLRDFYLSLPPVTRMLCTMSVSLTAMHALGVAPPELFALHGPRTFRALELWRPFTAALFPGPLSLSCLANIYLFSQYSRQLETLIKGESAGYLVFAMFQIILLSGICLPLRLPFFFSALTASSTFLCSIHNPFDKVNVLFGIETEYWKLPFLSIGIDVLHAQNLRAALPGVLGLAAGGFFWLVGEKVPRLIAPPRWLRNAFLKQQNNVFDFRHGVKGGVVLDRLRWWWQQHSRKRIEPTQADIDDLDDHQCFDELD